MKIEDAIKRYESWAEDDRIDVLIRNEHRQIADWLKELKADSPQRWIPCSERLPEEDKDVLAWVESTHDARIACCNYAKGVWFDAIMDVVVKPIAWMPLPKPWKGEYDENY